MKLEPVAWIDPYATNAILSEDVVMMSATSKKHATFTAPLYAIPEGYALVSAEPTDKEFELLFEAYNKDYHADDQMQDVIDRILALRKITIAAAKGE